VHRHSIREENLALTGPLPGIDLIGEIIAAVISLLITYYAHKAYRLSGQRSLFLLYLGFLMVGFGFIAQTIALILGAFLPSGTPPPPSNRGLERLLFAVSVGSGIHWLLEILGYITIFIAYLYQSRGTETNIVTPIAGVIALQIVSIGRIILRPELEIVIFLILVFILIQVIFLFIPQRHRSTLYVILGFLFLSLAHLTFLLFSYFETSETIYALGHLLQLTGFLLLLATLLSTTRGK
jgi:hypothetical protein